MAFLAIAIFIAGFLSGSYVWGSGSYTTISSSGIDVPGFINATEYWWGSHNRTDVFANPQMPYSYEISVENGVVKAKNGSTGQIEFSGSDAATVIQSAINALTSGGKIFIKRGYYYLSSSLTIPSGAHPIILEGEGYSTQLKSQLGAEVVTLTINGRYSEIRNILLYAQTSGDPHGIVLGNIDGYLKVVDCWLIGFRYGIWQYHGDSRYWIERNYFSNGKHAIILEGKEAVVCQNFFTSLEWNGIKARRANKLIIAENTFIDVNTNLETSGCINIESGSTNTENVIIEGNKITWTENPSATTNGILLQGSNEDTSVIGVTIQNNILDGGSYSNINALIYLHGYNSTTYNVEKITIAGNVLRNAKYGIITTYSKDVNVYGNILENMSGSPYLNGGGSNYKVHHNIGYVTENSGTATIPAGSTSVTVSHGLADTPSKVLVTPIGDPGDRFWVANVGSSSFDIVVATAPSADTDFYWQAEL